MDEETLQERDTALIMRWFYQLHEEGFPQEPDPVAKMVLQSVREHLDQPPGTIAVSMHSIDPTAVTEMAQWASAVALPFAVTALDRFAPSILSILTSPLTTSFVSAVSSGLEVVEIREKSRFSWRPFSRKKKADRPVPLPPSEEYQPLRLLVEAMGDEMVKSGISRQRADAITLRTLKVLLNEPQGAASLVEALIRRY